MIPEKIENNKKILRSKSEGVIPMQDISLAGCERKKEPRNGKAFHGLNRPKYLYEVLPDGSWAGKRCFIVGGGPSLKDFDFSLLDGELTIGINRAFEKFSPTMIFCGDKRMWSWIELQKFGSKTKRLFRDSKAYKVFLDLKDNALPDDILRIDPAAKDGITKRLKDGIGLGDNSGFMALNIAVCLGANPIYLLGFDMKGNGNGKQAWWRGGYPEIQDEEVYDRMISYFNDSAKEIRALDVRVINLSPESNLRCFDFADVEDVLENAVYMEGYAGIGDNFWQRPHIKELCKKKTVYLKTFTPQVYHDIDNIRFVYPEHTVFRTHKKNADRLPKHIWYDKPEHVSEIEKPLY